MPDQIDLTAAGDSVPIAYWNPTAMQLIEGKVFKTDIRMAFGDSEFEIINTDTVHWGSMPGGGVEGNAS